MSKYRVAIQKTITAYVEVELSDQELLTSGVTEPTATRARQLAIIKALDSEFTPTVSVVNYNTLRDVTFEDSHWYTPAWEDPNEACAEYIP